MVYQFFSTYYNNGNGMLFKVDKGFTLIENLITYLNYLITTVDKNENVVSKTIHRTY